ncbi:hypothetical protein N0V82_000629 [Gnomoniopsis sp. IMI 355080]|nr:hypothetical protein N0V82_000629 [Gnomoniopsis sp. IMI 355080]
MFCILGPEMGLGDPQLAGRTLRSRFSSSKLKDSMQVNQENPSPDRSRGHRTLGSLISYNYGSVKSSVKRATSVRVTKRERKITKAQDIFPSYQESARRLNTPDFRSLEGERSVSNATAGRATTPSNTLSLDKPLPATPDDRNEVENDVLVQDFEGYLDILAYLQRGLPSRPKVEQGPRPERGTSPAPVQAVLTPAPKEEEWMSTRPVSQTSSYKTVSAASDELRRLKSLSPSGAPTRCTSVSENTVTPKSSRESEWGMRGGKTALPGLGFASRIEEVSEPGTASPVLTPDRRSTSVPQVCYHCGRDPTGKDVKDMTGTPTTVLEMSKFHNLSEADLRKSRGPVITAKDAQGQRYALYPETSYYKALEDAEDAKDKMPKTPENAEFIDFSSPVARPSNPDPYATTYSSPDELPKQRQRAEIEIENAAEVYEDTDATPPSNWRSGASVLKEVPEPDPSSTGSESPSFRPGQNETTEIETEATPDRSFWKNPEGVILVYQGVEVGGKELVYGADINYLGSFYDDDEGSSGLGSTGESSHDLVGTGSGLAVIPECGSSDDLWDDEAFDAR